MLPSTPHWALADWDRLHFLLCPSLIALRLLGKDGEKEIRTPHKTAGRWQAGGKRREGEIQKSSWRLWKEMENKVNGTVVTVWYQVGARLVGGITT